jgi:uncharacterized protein YdhG (YjbR/CyaY superfamily)
MMMKKVASLDEYIREFPSEVQKVLEKIRETIKKEAPNATEAISYGIPTFKLNGNLVHFGAYEKHVGFYPGAMAIEVFQKEMGEYITGKGTIQFQLSEPIPYHLISKITAYRVKEQLKKSKRSY